MSFDLSAFRERRFYFWADDSQATGAAQYIPLLLPCLFPVLVGHPLSWFEDAMNEGIPFGDDVLEVSPQFPNPRAHAEFYKRFNHEVDKHNDDSVSKYDGQMSTTLFFGYLISVITSIFIIDVQSQLRPDYARMNHVLLTIIANASLGEVPISPDPASSQWIGPDPAIIHVQVMLYWSLTISLLAVFITILGSRWLSRYSQAKLRGSSVGRGRRQPPAFNVTWYFDLVIECLSLMPQVSLLLLVYALSKYLSFVNEVVAGVVVGLSAFGLLLHFLVTSTAILSFNHAPKAPFSLVLRFFAYIGEKRRKHIQRSAQQFGKPFSQGEKPPQANSCGPSAPNNLDKSDEKDTGDHLELTVAGPVDQPPPSFSWATDWSGHVLDSNCISRMFELPVDEEDTLAIVKFIPEIAWHTGIRTAPLERLYDTVLECFDSSSGRPVVIPSFRNKAYLGAKALLHLAIQRKCIDHDSDKAAFTSISKRHQILGYRHYIGDADLESTLGIVDRVLGDRFEPTCWYGFPSTVSHHTWMGHILLYRAWDVSRKGEPLPDDTKQFVLYSLLLSPPVASPIVADCLFIVGLALGIELHINYLSVTDKSQEIYSQICRIYDKLTETFQRPDTTTNEIDCALKAMELMVPLIGEDVAKKSYHLFQVIMHTPLSLAHSQEKKWKASRLALRCAFKLDSLFPQVENLQDILTFLAYHVDLVAPDGENQDEPIESALRALAHATPTDALDRFDSTESFFVRCMRYAFQNDRPPTLHKVALLLLPLIGEKWFNTPDPIMEPDQMESLCVDWASTVDSVLHDNSVQVAIVKVLLDMMNSPHWRPHVVTEKWKLLGDYHFVLDDSDDLKRCLDNPDLIRVVSEVENPDVRTPWLTVFWLKYKDLTPEVRELLEKVTGEVAQSRGVEIGTYLSAVDSELEKAKNKPEDYGGWGFDPLDAAATKMKVENLTQTRISLVAFQRD